MTSYLKPCQDTVFGLKGLSGSNPVLENSVLYLISTLFGLNEHPLLNQQCVHTKGMYIRQVAPYRP